MNIDTAADSDSNDSFEWFFDIGLTGYHVEKAMGQPKLPPAEVIETLKLIQPSKFNLGCKAYTMSISGGWLNVESFVFGAGPNKFVKSQAIVDADRGVYLNYDLLGGVPALDESLDVVYHSLLIDVFSYEKSLSFFDEVYRVLKPGGKHFLAVMNGPALLDAYLHQSSDLFAIQREIFGDQLNLVGSEVYQQPGSALSRLLFQQGLKSFWDIDSLSAALERTGFVDIQRRDIGVSSESEINLVESKYHPLREKFCFFVQCQK